MLKVGIVMGGYSGESVISLKSGQLILDKINKEKYQPYEVHILKDKWVGLIDGVEYPIDKADFSINKDGGKIEFNVVVNTIHGTPGEDGHMQAYWELLNIPYTGCSFYQSALTFNKRDTLSVLSKFNIPMAKSIYLTKGDLIDKDFIIKELQLPVMVKPNQSGSSLGVSKVDDIQELDIALEKAFHEDDDILIEEYIKGIEVSVGVLKYQGKTKVLGITEIVSENNFFDYEAKYLGKSKEITPARLEPIIVQKVEETAQYIYEALGMTGFSRSDFIIRDGIPYFIEMNTNPGLSPASIFPQQAEQAKIDFKDLLDNEINLALKRK